MRSGRRTPSPELVSAEEEPLRTELLARRQLIEDRYAVLSVQYQESKDGNEIPLS